MSFFTVSPNDIHSRQNAIQCKGIVFTVCLYTLVLMQESRTWNYLPKCRCTYQE